MSEGERREALPALRTVTTQKHRGGIRWDEANLEANEGIKRDLNPQKILEPKTPYLSPMETDDELDIEGKGMSPLKLDDEEGGGLRPGLGSDEGASFPPSSTSSQPSAWSDSDRSAGRSPRVAGRSPRFSIDTVWEGVEDGDIDSADPERREKRRRFREARRLHYNMKTSLQHGTDGSDSDNQEGPLAPAPSMVETVPQ